MKNVDISPLTMIKEYKSVLIFGCNTISVLNKEKWKKIQILKNK